MGNLVLDTDRSSITRGPQLSGHPFGCAEAGNGFQVKVDGKVQFLFRRPTFPVVCAAGRELISAGSTASFQRQVERLKLQGGEVLDVVDATGEGWVFHGDLMIVSPLTLKKRWTKAAVIRRFNESENARRLGAAYPETSLSGKTLTRIITDVAALAAYGKPKGPRRRMGA